MRGNHCVTTATKIILLKAGLLLFCRQVSKARRQNGPESGAAAAQSWEETAQSRSQGNQEKTETREEGTAVERTLYLRQSQPNKHGLSVNPGSGLAPLYCLRQSLRSGPSPRPHPRPGPWSPGVQSRVSATPDGRPSVLGTSKPSWDAIKSFFSKTRNQICHLCNLVCVSVSLAALGWWKMLELPQCENCCCFLVFLRNFDFELQKLRKKNLGSCFFDGFYQKPGLFSTMLCTLETRGPGVSHTSLVPTMAALFLDENLPDGTRLEPGTKFIKYWKMRNSGTISWTSETKVPLPPVERRGRALSLPLSHPASLPLWAPPKLYLSTNQLSFPA